MSNKIKKIISVLGIMIGITIIIVGINVKDVEYSRADTGGIGRYITFGADFYTEIYNVTKDVGYAVNNNTIALNNITNVLANICNAIGWLIIAIGTTDICFFCYKLCVTDTNTQTIEYTSTSKRINNLEKLYSQGLISEQEYQELISKEK